MSFLKEIRDIKSTKKELREFAFVVGGVILLIAGLRYWHQNSLYLQLAAAGGTLVAFGFLAPQFLKHLQKAWMTLALMMGWVMTRVILTVLFFFILTPISLIARATGKRFLDLKFRETEAPTYWTLRPLPVNPKETYEKQF